MKKTTRAIGLFTTLLILSTNPAAGSATGSSSANLKTTVLTDNLASPWGLTFLPNGQLLVTQKSGHMVILNRAGETVSTLSGLPPVDDSGQGGLLDVAIDPDFDTDPWVYWSFAEPGRGLNGWQSGTAVARGRLAGNELRDIEVIYRQDPKTAGSGHYGSRLAFGRDKHLFITLGDRKKKMPAQDLKTTLGKTIRIKRDGSIPRDNPAIPGARPEIWSYGHRNPQGAAVWPGSSELWISEHGPQGGDEINRIVPGGNYGWPLVSYGCNYGAIPLESCRIGGGVHAPDYVEPVSIWVPTSTAPAGMIFYTGKHFPQWRGDILLGALRGRALWRIELVEGREKSREKLLDELGERIRDVEQGPDGRVYLLTDSGKLIRLSR